LPFIRLPDACGGVKLHVTLSMYTTGERLG
jgi:hypothetical protein